MQFSTVEIRFIVTTWLYSTFANDLKENIFFRKMFTVTEYAALSGRFTQALLYMMNTVILSYVISLPNTEIRWNGNDLRKNVKSLTKT